MVQDCNYGCGLVVPCDTSGPLSWERGFSTKNKQRWALLKQIFLALDAM